VFILPPATVTGAPENYYSELFDSIVLGKETPNYGLSNVWIIAYIRHQDKMLLLLTNPRPPLSAIPAIDHYR
jgi:hypothetical protein